MIKFIFIITLVICNLSFAAKKMNVLFIAADDLNVDIACYGKTQVKTPNLDRLAKMGVRFDRAYCQQPLCGPSRASVMTGLRPNTTGFVYLNDDLRKLKPNAVTLGQFFQNQGYYSARVGKIYHYSNPRQIGTDGNDDIATWNERFNPAGIDRTQEQNITVYPESKKGKGLGISMAWWDPLSKDEEHTDGMVASKVINLIEKHKDKPFFIAAGFYNPHCPYVAPKRYFDLYDLNKITMQDWKSARADLTDVPAMAIQRDSKNWPYFFPNVSLEEARKCKLAYYATVSFIDAQVGRLLDCLEKNNLMDSTIIVFWSDHGYFLGEKGLWYKRKNFERSVRVPLLISGPSINPDKDCFRQVELIDLYPTLADYTGHTIPAGLDGVSLRPLLSNPEMQWDRPAITQVHHSDKAQGYSMKLGDWRYTEWNNGQAGKELYNHQSDPDEITNLAKNPEYTELMAEYRKQLQEYSSKYKPHNSKQTRHDK
jgi:iduronate 2-sulfatase